METTAGQRLKLMLEDSGKSQSWLAAKLEVSPSTVGNWVQGVNQIGDNEKFEILKHMPDYSEAWFFAEAGQMKIVNTQDPEVEYKRNCKECKNKEKTISELWRIIDEKSKTIDQLLSKQGEGGRIAKPA